MHNTINKTWVVQWSTPKHEPKHQLEKWLNSLIGVLCTYVRTDAGTDTTNKYNEPLFRLVLALVCTWMWIKNNNKTSKSVDIRICITFLSARPIALLPPGPPWKRLIITMVVSKSYQDHIRKRSFFHMPIRSGKMALTNFTTLPRMSMKVNWLNFTWKPETLFSFIHFWSMDQVLRH